MAPYFILALGAIMTALPSYAWDHYVTVGKDGNSFNPPYVQAQVHDKIKFQFFPKNHTLTQSTFDKPCSPLDWGINSGFKPVQDSYNTQWFEVEVKDTKVQWFYCQQGTHCSKDGMTFAINPPTWGDKTFKAFQDKAKSSAQYGAGQGSNWGGNNNQGSDKNNQYGQPDKDYNNGGDKQYGQGSDKNNQYGQPDKGYNNGGDKQYGQGSDKNNQYGQPDKGSTYGNGQNQNGGGQYGQPTTHTVTVGADNQLKYSPSQVDAKVGDIVTFKFSPKNHTVTQSSFENPCESNGGFKSGFRPVQMGDSSQTFSITINDTKPIWVYCGQKSPVSHCQAGMVFAVNPAGKFDAFLDLAKKSQPKNDASSNNGQNQNGGGQYGQPKTHTVTVGADNQLKYSPEQLDANVGDIVTFNFSPKNHTVTQSSFENPCESNGGFKSGFRPVQMGDSSQTFSITINDTKPIWVYCGQKSPVSHCQAGMVLGINAPKSGDKTFDAFLKLAKSNSTGAASSSGSSSGTKMVSGALSGDEESDYWSKWAPVIIGLLGANLFITLILAVSSLLGYIRRGGKESTRSLSASYAPVRVKETEAHPYPGIPFKDEDTRYSEQ